MNVDGMGNQFHRTLLCSDIRKLSSAICRTTVLNAELCYRVTKGSGIHSLKLHFMLPAGFHEHCKPSGGSTQNINDV